jgi:3-oxosteroid 1-dehydrogenase
MSNSRNPYQDPWWERVIAAGIPPRPVARDVTDRTTYDAIVVGSGMAAYVTAMVVADAGDSVVMLEAAQEAGGTTYKSGAGMWVPDNAIMRERGLGPNRDWAMRHMASLAFPDTYDATAERFGLEQRDFDLIETYYDNAARVFSDLASRGLKLMEFPSFTGNFEAMVEYHGDTEHGFGAHLAPKQDNGGYGAGIHLVQQLEALAAARGIELRTGHHVTGVLQEDGGVVGVTAETATGALSLHARKGVVFCTGGYPHNRELTRRYFPGGLYGSCAVPSARGDFIAIASELGAELGNMGQGWGTQHPLQQLLADGEVTEHVGVFPGDSSFMVNAEGRRVVNEKLTYHERSKTHFQRADDGTLPNHLLFLIYDDFIVDDRTSQPNRWPNPEPGNAWVIDGQTLDELAGKIEAWLAANADAIDGFSLAPTFRTGLAETFERFNALARAGVDEDFHRGESAVELDWTGPSHIENDKNPTMWPLDDGPYHCIILAGSVLDTNGGPRANASGQILRSDGSAIPGLYGAGNCVASVAGAGYFSGGSTLGPAATFAHLAGTHLASQRARDLSALMPAV